MSKKNEFVKIEALAGSLVITPKEIKAFKRHGINLEKGLKKIQSEIYKS